MRKPATTQPDTQHGPADANAVLRLKPFNHLGQGDILLFIDHSEDEGFVCIEP